MRPINAPAWLTARPIAHRGLHDAERGIVENTLAAAEAAIAGGFAIECDVQPSADREAFVFHDGTLDRLTDMQGPLNEMSAETIRRARLRVAGAPAPLVGEGRGGGSRPAGIVECTVVVQTTILTVAAGTADRVRSKDAATPDPSLPLQGGRGPDPPALPPLPAPSRIPTFAELLTLVAGRTPIICELKSRFDGDWRVADRVAALAAGYEGPLALKSFDPDLVAYLRLRWPGLGPAGRPCPVGVVAEASYDRPAWAFLTAEQKRDCESFEHRHRSQPDFLSWNVDDLPHKTPFFEKELHGLPVMAWTVRTSAQREAAAKWADQIVFEGEGRPFGCEQNEGLAGEHSGSASRPLDR